MGGPGSNRAPTSPWQGPPAAERTPLRSCWAVGRLVPVHPRPLAGAAGVRRRPRLPRGPPEPRRANPSMVPPGAPARLVAVALLLGDFVVTYLSRRLLFLELLLGFVDHRCARWSCLADPMAIWSAAWHVRTGDRVRERLPAAGRRPDPDGGGRVPRSRSPCPRPRSAADIPGSPAPSWACSDYRDDGRCRMRFLDLFVGGPRGRRPCPDPAGQDREPAPQPPRCREARPGSPCLEAAAEAARRAPRCRRAGLLRCARRRVVGSRARAGRRRRSGETAPPAELCRRALDPRDSDRAQQVSWSTEPIDSRAGWSAPVAGGGARPPPTPTGSCCWCCAVILNQIFDVFSTLATSVVGCPTTTALFIPSRPTAPTMTSSTGSANWMLFFQARPPPSTLPQPLPPRTSSPC